MSELLNIFIVPTECYSCIKQTVFFAFVNSDIIVRVDLWQKNYHVPYTEKISFSRAYSVLALCKSFDLLP